MLFNVFFSSNYYEYREWEEYEGIDLRFISHALAFFDTMVFPRKGIWLLQSLINVAVAPFLVAFSI